VGQLGFVGTLLKQTRKPVAGSVSFSGVLSQFIVFLRTVSGTLAPVGAIVKQTRKNIAGFLTPTGATTKQTGKNVAGAVTPSGIAGKDTQKNVAGGVTPVGDLTPQTSLQQAVAGVLTLSGALTALFIAAGDATGRVYRRMLTVMNTLRHRR
jgi:hypothetical protein